MGNGWHNVNKEEPCPICGKTDWCSVSDDGAVCVCRRTESPHPTKSGIGWIHRLREGSEVGRRGGGGERILIQTSTHPSLDADAYFRKLATGNEQVRLCRYLMREISIPCDMMLTMDVRWDRQAKCAAFPMRDADGKITGLRYRQLKTGSKWSLKGGKDGLFYIPDFFSGQSRELVVCEGPTDMLAAASCGITNVVGRSSCMTGANHILEMLRLIKAECVSIVADDDKPKTRPDGSTFTPGIDGARKLAQDLRVPSRIMFPPPGFKDMREWYAKGGMTAEAFRSIAAGAKWEVPK